VVRRLEEVLCVEEFGGLYCCICKIVARVETSNEDVERKRGAYVAQRFSFDIQQLHKVLNMALKSYWKYIIAKNFGQML